MLQRVKFVFAAFLTAFALQWLLGFELGLKSPDVMLVAVVCFSLIAGPVLSQFFAFVCGIYLDFLGVDLFGAYALMFVVSAYLIGLIRRNMDFTAPPAQALAGFAVSVFVLAGYSILGLIFTGSTGLNGWRYFLGAPFFNALAAPLLYYVFSAFGKKAFNQI